MISDHRILTFNFSDDLIIGPACRKMPPDFEDSSVLHLENSGTGTFIINEITNIRSGGHMKGVVERRPAAGAIHNKDTVTGREPPNGGESRSLISNDQPSPVDKMKRSVSAIASLKEIPNFQRGSFAIDDHFTDGSLLVCDTETSVHLIRTENRASAIENFQRSGISSAVSNIGDRSPITTDIQLGAGAVDQNRTRLRAVCVDAQNSACVDNSATFDNQRSFPIWLVTDVNLDSGSIGKSVYQSTVGNDHLALSVTADSKPAVVIIRKLDQRTGSIERQVAFTTKTIGKNRLPGRTVGASKTPT